MKAQQQHHQPIMGAINNISGSNYMSCLQQTFSAPLQVVSKNDLQIANECSDDVGAGSIVSTEDELHAILWDNVYCG